MRNVDSLHTFYNYQGYRVWESEYFDILISDKHNDVFKKLFYFSYNHISEAHIETFQKWVSDKKAKFPNRKFRFDLR